MNDTRADEHDIAKVLVRYATGIDRRDWALFRAVFTDDVVADYPGVGLWTSSEEITAFMEVSHVDMGHTMHRLSNLAITVDGDTATARSYVDAVLMAPDGQSGLNPIGFYDDELVRTADGWRIARRTFTMVHFRTLEVPDPMSATTPSEHEELEAIRQLKARYFRTMDTKDWAGMRQVFTDDVVIDTSEAGGSLVEGADTFMAFLQEALGGATTVHQGHMPELALTSGTTATGVWALNDIVIWPNGMRLDGYGHYHETYEKLADGWRIRSSKLTRLHVDFVMPEGD